MVSLERRSWHFRVLGETKGNISGNGGRFVLTN